MENEENDPQARSPRPARQIERSEDFENLYANYVMLEGTVWDLQMIFGELQSGVSGEPVIRQHTAMTIPWTQAKVLAFHLAMAVIGNEETHGPVRLPAAVVPMVASLNEKARSDIKIMSIFTSLMQTGNPELFTSAPPPPSDAPPSEG